MLNRARTGHSDIPSFIFSSPGSQTLLPHTIFLCSGRASPPGQGGQLCFWQATVLALLLGFIEAFLHEPCFLLSRSAQRPPCGHWLAAEPSILPGLGRLLELGVSSHLLACVPCAPVGPHLRTLSTPGHQLGLGTPRICPFLSAKGPGLCDGDEVPTMQR